jgi:hypothetical protein
MEGFEPRPRAAQETAAKQRQRPAHEDIEPITPQAPPDMRRYVPFALAAAAALLIGTLSYGLSRQSTRPLQLAPTEAPVQTFAKQPQEATSAPTSEATALPRTIGAYAAPGGTLLGQIEADRTIIPVAHYGSAWVAYQDGAGLVWLRTSDVPGVALAGPDLAPQPQGRGPAPQAPPDVAPPPAVEPAPAPWPVSAPFVPDTEQPNIKEHFNAPGQGAGQEG